jgi:hypothetical protein
LRKGDYFHEFSALLQDFLDTCQMPEPATEPESSAKDEAVKAGETTDKEEAGSSPPDPS